MIHKNCVAKSVIKQVRRRYWRDLEDCTKKDSHTTKEHATMHRVTINRTIDVLDELLGEQI